MVLTVYADRATRLWRIAETCARCAASTFNCRILDTASPSRPGQTGPAQPEKTPAGERVTAPCAAGHATAMFSDRSAYLPPGAPSSPASSVTPLPDERSAAPTTKSGRLKRWGKIAQRTVPHDLKPESLRAELVDLGDAYRAYQQLPESDLAFLADLHARKARAFRLWADVTGDDSLRQEARRAEKAVDTTHGMHVSRGDGPVGERVLTASQADHARAILDYVASHAPHSEAEVHLAVLMLTLRAARAGTGHVTGQDLIGWLQGDTEQVLERLVAVDWLRLPDTVAALMASSPEDPTAITVPALLAEQSRPFGFGKTTRARISGWAQKTVGDRKIRRKKLGAAIPLLALYTAAHSRPDGCLGHPEDDGLDLRKVAAFCALRPEQIAEHAEVLMSADWLTEADISAGRMRGQLAERVLPLGAPL
ncbi:hypothetical protein [Streptomyces sp. NBC_01497]|uniref:hypothetical protein n=1 Tax=Streptomyces sp. NBC_01497 TaxID=2903885 RepID=UPI002E33EB93|nr:hypothetical protein [Streptomyces sp. NBC_01497]